MGKTKIITIGDKQWTIKEPYLQIKDWTQLKLMEMGQYGEDELVKTAQVMIDMKKEYMTKLVISPRTFTKEYLESEEAEGDLSKLEDALFEYVVNLVKEGLMEQKKKLLT